jgi:hypothetical protein
MSEDSLLERAPPPPKNARFRRIHSSPTGAPGSKSSHDMDVVLSSGQSRSLDRFLITRFVFLGTTSLASEAGKRRIALKKERKGNHNRRRIF